MAQAASSRATKHATRKTKSTHNEDFLYDLGLPPAPFASAMEQSLFPTGDTEKAEKPLTGIKAFPSLQKLLLDDQAPTQNDQLAQRIILVRAEREMSMNVEYHKLDLAEFVAGYRSMIKTYDPEVTNFMLSHLELLLIKGTSYSWSSVRSFHAHIAKQVELYRSEWSDTAEIHDRANTFFKHSDLRTAPTSRVTATPPWTTNSKQHGGQETHGCKQWNYTGSSTCEKDTYAAQHKCCVCTQDHPMFHCPKRRNPIPSTFDNPPSLPNFLPSIRPRTCQRRMSFRTRYHTQECWASFHWTLILRVLTSPLLSVTSLLPDQIAPMHSGQKSRCIPHWRLTCGKIFCLIITIRSWWNFWSMVSRLIIAPVNCLISTMCNHPSALAFPYCVRHYIQTELSFRVITGPFLANPLQKPLVSSPLQTVPKHGSSKCRVVLDLSFPPTFPVNSGIPFNTYLDSPLNVQLLGIDHLCQFILAKGRGCCVYKNDLQRTYRQFPINPKDYYLLGFTFDNHIYFDTQCPFGLRTLAMICQRTTKGVIYIFTQAGFSADFYGTECPLLADNAFGTLESIFDTLALSLFAWKRFTAGIWDGLLRYPRQYQGFYIRCSRTAASWIWLFTVKELQSLLGKLSFVTACVHASRIFLSRLLNTLRSFSSNAKSQLVMLEMPHDLAWWQTFHPLYNGVCIIKPADWSFADFRFTTDARPTRGGAMCLDKCLTFPFLDFVIHAASHICALELFPVIIVVKFWATGLQHRRFLVSCDNEVVVTVINSGSTKDPFMQRCLGQLWFTSALHDVDLHVRHILGEHNTLAYALSRWHNTSSQTRFAQAATALGISYFFEEIPGDFCYFDLVWYFFASVRVFFGLFPHFNYSDIYRFFFQGTLPMFLHLMPLLSV